MALSKEQKQQQISELTNLLKDSKITVIASYDKVSVSELQELRSSASEQGTTVRVAKNRLVKIAMADIDSLKDADISNVKGQVLYAFNNQDEVAPAKALHEFSKKNPNLQFVGGFDSVGQSLDQDKLKALAQLPSKEQLLAQVVGTIAAPMNGFVNVLAGNIRGVVNVLNARKQQLEG